MHLLRRTMMPIRSSGCERLTIASGDLFAILSISRSVMTTAMSRNMNSNFPIKSLCFGVWHDMTLTYKSADASLNPILQHPSTLWDSTSYREWQYHEKQSKEDAVVG